MKVTRNYEDGIRTEEITLARIGKEGFRIVLGLLKIVACVASAIWVIWLFVPDPEWRYWSYVPQLCGILYPLLRRG